MVIMYVRTMHHVSTYEILISPFTNKNDTVSSCFLIASV